MKVKASFSSSCCTLTQHASKVFLTSWVGKCGWTREIVWVLFLRLRWEKRKFFFLFVCKMESFSFHLALNSLSANELRIFSWESASKWKWMWKCMKNKWHREGCAWVGKVVERETFSFEKKFTFFFIFGESSSWALAVVLVNDVRLCSEHSLPPNAMLHNKNDSLAPLNVSLIPIPRRTPHLLVLLSPHRHEHISMHIQHNRTLCSRSPCKFHSSLPAFQLDSRLTVVHSYSDSGRPINNHPSALPCSWASWKKRAPHYAVIISGCHSIWIRKL